MAAGMTTIRLELPKLHAAQAQILHESKRLNVVCAGRRIGKSVLGIDRLIQPALHGLPVAYFCPTYRMTSEIWREVVRIVKPLTARVSTQEHRIELVTGGLIEIWSLDTPDIARGRKYARVIIDEAAMVPELEKAWHEVIRPTLADLKGSAWFLSTPKGLNFFHTLFQFGQDDDHPEWASWQLPTSSNPFIDPAEIAAMANGLPEQTYAQEILAQFIGDGGGVFRRVMKSATATPQDRAIPGHSYIVGADWGRSKDYTVFAVIDTTINELCHVDRFNMLDYSVQVSRLQVLCERFDPETIIAESNSIGVPVIEQIEALNLPVEPFLTTQASKKAAIEGLQLAFERGVLKIIKHQVVLGELMAYDSVRLPSGMLRYSAPQGQHDDIVMALALAWYGASHATAPMPYAGGEYQVSAPYQPY